MRSCTELLYLLTHGQYTRMLGLAAERDHRSQDEERLGYA